MANHRRRLRKGTHPNGHLQAAYNKYGDSALVFEVISYTQNYLAEEQAEIDGSDFDTLYNLSEKVTHPSDGGWGRDLQRDALLKAKLAERNRSQSKKGWKRTEANISRMSRDALLRGGHRVLVLTPEGDENVYRSIRQCAASVGRDHKQVCAYLGQKWRPSGTLQGYTFLREGEAFLYPQHK